MAGADTISPPIESRDDLIGAMERGAKDRQHWRVGTEHEKHVFYRNPIRPVPYEGENGVHALLDGVARETGWEPFFDEGNPIGLWSKETMGGISLEPGGQFELSGAPQPDMHAAAAEMSAHMAVSHKVGDALGINFLGLGVTPLWSVKDIPVMPKSRYGIMAPYMDKVGTLGTSMMFRSATVQSNLDFSSEADMVKKLRVSLALQPLVTALFANSPFVDGKDSGFLTFRSHIWLNTDRNRTGMLPFAFEDGMGFERYADYALDVPMYFVIRDGHYINVAGESFRDFLEGKLPQLPGEKPTKRDWNYHLGTIFPEVRLKSFLEMRGADMGDEASVTALSAFWTGILYDDIALDVAWDLVKDWNEGDRQKLREDVPRLGLKARWPGDILRFGDLGDAAREIVGVASAGLARRARLNARGEDESIYLAPLEKTIQLQKTPAERLLDLYRGEWAGDVTKVFDAAAI